MESINFEFNAENCLYEVRVNDFCIIKEKSGLKLVSREPLNYLIYGKSFTLSININPIKGKNVLDETVSFSCAIVSSDGNRRNNIFTYQLEPSQLFTPELIINQVITTTDSKITPAWTKGSLIQINEDIIGVVLKEYVKIWNFFKSKEINKMMDYFAIKEQTYAAAFGITVEERMKESIAEYNSMVNDTEYDLFDIKPQFFNPKIQCYGKVISLEDELGFHPVFFFSKDKKNSIKIQTYFAMIDKQLKVVL